MNFKLFKVLNHRETKNVYIFDIKLYTENCIGYKDVIAEGRVSVNIKTGNGQCSVFAFNTKLKDEDIDEIVKSCLQRARSLQERVFKEE